MERSSAALVQFEREELPSGETLKLTGEQEMMEDEPQRGKKQRRPHGAARTCA